MEEEMFFVEEVAKKLRVTRKTVYDWMRDGRLEYVQVGGRRRITASALAAFIKSGRDTERDAEKNEAPGLVQPALAGF